MRNDGKLYLSDLPDAGDFDPEVWDLPDTVTVEPLGNVDDAIVLVSQNIQRLVTGKTRRIDATRVRGALRSLAALTNGDHKGLQRFVEQYGRLQLAAPSGLPQRDAPLSISAMPAWPNGALSVVEMASQYFAIASALDRVLHLLDALRKSEIRDDDVNETRSQLERLPVPPEQRHELVFGILVAQSKAATGVKPATHTARQARALVSSFVNWWMGVGFVTPLVSWRSGRIPRVLWSGGLWGAIGSQLLVAVAEERRVSRSAGQRIVRKRRVPCFYCGVRILRQRRKEKPCCGKASCEAQRVASWRDELEESLA